MPPKERKLPEMKETVVIPPEHRIKRKASPWVQHVQDWAKSHNTTFFRALKMPECKDSYHSSKK